MDDKRNEIFTVKELKFREIIFLSEICDFENFVFHRIYCKNRRASRNCTEF